MAVLYGGDTIEERRKALEDRIGADRVVQLFDDDGDGLVEDGDLEKLEITLGDADDIVTGLLVKKAWTTDQLQFIRLDRQVVRAWSGIAAQLAAERKPEWLDAEGRGRFDAFGVRGRAELGALARGELRSVQEPDAGPTASIGGEVDDHPREFAPDPRIPGHRGNGSF
jgi:hypothetical protein